MADPLQTPPAAAAATAPASPPAPTATAPAATSDPLADALAKWATTRDARESARSVLLAADKDHEQSEVPCRDGLQAAGHVGPENPKRVGDALYYLVSGQVVRVAIPPA